MPTILKTKNSVTTTVVPTTLQQGELAVNITDKKLWVGNAATTPVQLLGAGVTGDVVGPASATDNALARFDATTGKLIQNSVGILSDAGALTGITDFTYTGTLTGGTGIVNLGSGQFYKDASGNVIIGGTTQRLSAKITNNGGYWAGSGNSSGDAEYFLSNYATATTAWAMSVRQDVGGANNNLKFLRLNSSGTFQDVAVQITQAEGNVNLNKNLGIGGATATTSGTGITFPATQSGSSDANTLDDYEEGTWTPSVTFGGGSTSLTYTNRAGWYTKVGNMVCVQYNIFFSNTGSSDGNAEVSGLPFTSSNDTYKRTNAYQFTDRMTPNQMLSNSNATTFTFQTLSTGTGSTAVSLTRSDFTSNTYISGSFTYFV
jgi:hypothetical protein